MSAATALLFLACLVQAAGTGALIVERCQECHGLDKTCEAGSDDAQWWDDTVARMVEYKAELLTADEAATVGRFLADPKNRASVCVAQ
jgi:cytochrome c2